MTRKFKSTRKFDKLFKTLDEKIKKQTLKVIDLFIRDPFHPSLRLKKVQGTERFYEVSVNMSMRIIIEINHDGEDQINTFYVIGKHEDVFPVN